MSEKGLCLNYSLTKVGENRRKRRTLMPNQRQTDALESKGYMDKNVAKRANLKMSFKL